MKNLDPTTLALRDIHLPEPVSWWPPAAGWWWLAAGLSCALIVGLILWRRHAASRPQRAALAELAAIEVAYARNSDAHACAQGLSRLLRRLALLFGGSAAAAATGEQWLQLLDTLGPQPLPKEVRNILLVAPYSRTSAAGIAASDFRGLGGALKPWIRRLRPVRRQRPWQQYRKTRHAAV